MFQRYGEFVYRRARTVLAVSAVLLLVAVVLGIGAFSKLKGGGFTAPNAEATKAEQVINSQFGGRSNLVFLVHARAGTADAPAVAAAGRQLTTSLAAEPGVSDVLSYWTTKAPSLRSRDTQDGLLVLHVAGDEDTADDTAKTLITKYAVPGPTVTVAAGGSEAASVDIGHQVTKSLIIAESIAVPLTTLLLVLVFGSLVAAVLPLVVGTVAIFGTFAELHLLGTVTSVSEFAINLTTALGLGLGIDYSLLLVSRFREELANGAPTGPAVARTVATAGRTVLFAAATVAAALAALLVFPQYFLRSFAYAGIGVVVIAAVSALVVMPAMLAVLGANVNKGRVPWSGSTLAGESAFWRKVATTVMRHPGRYVVPVVLLFVALAAPLLHISFGTPDQGALPRSVSSRVVADRISTGFDGQGDSIDVVLTSGVRPPDLTAYAQRLSNLPGVVRVDSSAGSFAHGRSTTPGADPATFGQSQAEKLSVVDSFEAKTASAQDLVRAIRAIAAPSGATLLVGGPDADLVDTRHTIATRLPFGLALIVLTTFILLFLFTGSVIQPLRALLFNVLTLSASLGALTWIFQDGHLSGPLSFTARPMDTAMTVLFFCIAFGLSMDYEVFLISRIKELHDQGLPTDEAVAAGMARTGRIVSTAAALLAVSLLAFAAGTVSFLQMFGIGSGLAILLDATLVRAVLLPAWLATLGDLNWYAPALLRRLHARIAVSEAADEIPHATATSVNA
jgi:RND superfamily putative drug exporter